MPTTIAATTAAATTAAQKSKATLGSDFGTFLTLLTAQLQNQDPTKALDTNEMTQQLVQFASVEQQIGVNQNLQKLITLQAASQLTAAAPLVGRTVEVESDRLPLQEGRATLRLPPAGVATRADIVIQDAAGRTLRSAEVALRSAASDWVWDGRDSLGNVVPDGGYRFAVGGRTAEGTPQAISVGVRAKVTGAEQRDGAMQLLLGPVGVGFDKLRNLGT